MAKIKMLCPFSGELCRECPMYRGRHYYLCFSSRYRGRLDSDEKEKRGEEKINKTEGRSSASEYKFEMPPPLKPSPAWLVFADYPERKGK